MLIYAEIYSTIKSSSKETTLKLYHKKNSPSPHFKNYSTYD